MFKVHAHSSSSFRVDFLLRPAYGRRHKLHAGRPNLSQGTHISDQSRVRDLNGPIGTHVTEILGGQVINPSRKAHVCSVPVA